MLSRADSHAGLPESEGAHLFSVNLRDDNVQESDSKWDEVILFISKFPSEDVPESLYKLRIRDSEQRKTVLELYDMEIHQQISMPKYQKLKTIVKRSIDQKLRLRKFDARQGKIETGPVVKSRKGLKWCCKRKRYLFTVDLEKASVRRETSAVSGMRVMILHRNLHWKPLHPLSHQ